MNEIGTREVVEYAREFLKFTKSYLEGVKDAD